MAVIKARQCRQCGRWFPRYRLLQEHGRQEHRLTKEQKSEALKKSAEKRRRKLLGENM